jgi:lipopolysaccharide export system permease protein
MLVLNVTWAPIAQKKANELMLSLKKNTKVAKGSSFNIFYKSMQANRSWYIERFDFDTNEAENVDMVESDNEGRDLKKYIAARGTFADGHWKLHDVLIYEMQLKESDPGSTRRAAMVDLPDCKDSPEKFQMKLQKPARMSSRDISVSLHLDKGMPRQRRAQYLTELYHRFAFPFSNIVVLLIGIPFGVTPHRRSAFLAISNALLIFFAFQVTTQICLVLGNNDQIPAIVAGWFPNIAFGALGVYLIRQIR